MSYIPSRFLLASIAFLATAASVGAQTVAKAVPARVNVYQYAIDNPVENSALRAAPTLGASVPLGVVLAPCEDEKTYAYFYYDGRPVIVERSTRSVVRIGQ
jgi:hypothetical protein